MGYVGTRMRRGRGRSGKAHEEGASALEFALVVPVLLLLICGIIEFGVLFEAQLALTHAAREGARMATVGRYSETEVKGRAFPLVAVTVTTDPADVTTADSGDPITVTLSYDYAWTLLPFPGTVPLKSSAVMRRE